MIEHNRPWITAEDRAAVDAVLISGWVAQGPAARSLEAAFVGMYNGGAACAVSSGTAALALALRALGLGTHARVAVPTYACSALLNAVHWVGATPSVVDVLPGSFAIDASQLAGAQDAVIAVHTYGEPADIQACRRAAPVVIEDCCQSLGGTAGGRPLGLVGDAAVYSFYATKIVCGGQGGLVWSRQERVVDSVRNYREFDRRADYEPRFNLQLTDLQAALAVSQLRRLDTIVLRRRELALHYAEALPRGLALQDGLTADGRMPQRFVVLAPSLEVRDALKRHMQLAGVRCIVPVERFELLHCYLRLDPADFPVAERLADTTLSLPLYPALDDAQADAVRAALQAFRP